MSRPKIVKQSFYLSDNIIEVSKGLLGKIIETNINNQKTSGIIVETEAYAGIRDCASHSYQNKMTPRNQMMFKKGGRS